MARTIINAKDIRKALHLDFAQEGKHGKDGRLA